MIGLCKQGKVQVKVSLRMPWRYGGRWCTAPLILNPDTWWKWIASFIPHLLYTRRKSPQPTFKQNHCSSVVQPVAWSLYWLRYLGPRLHLFKLEFELCAGAQWWHEFDQVVTFSKSESSCTLSIKGASLDVALVYVFRAKNTTILQKYLELFLMSLPMSI
jgi:hypothetical protein